MRLGHGHMRYISTAMTYFMATVMLRRCTGALAMLQWCASNNLGEALISFFDNRDYAMPDCFDNAATVLR